MKGTDDKPVNEGIIIKGYKGSSGYSFNSEEVKKSFPLAIQGDLVDNDAMSVILWQAANKMYTQVDSQGKTLAGLTQKIAAIEERLNKLEPAIQQQKELKERQSEEMSDTSM